MGLFRKSRPTTPWAISAEQLHSEFRVLANEIKRMTEKLEGLESDRYAVPAMFRDVLRDAYVFLSVTTETADEIVLLVEANAVSPPASNAAMQSLKMFWESIDELRNRIQRGLIELGVEAKEAQEIFADSWAQAKSMRPTGLVTLEERNGVAFEWEWINDTTWK